MKWVLSHQSADNHKWLLQETNEPAQLTYNLQYRSIRIKSKNSRLFFLDVSGLFQKKILLRSEYGVVIGETQFGAANKDGIICMGEDKYFFHWEEHQLFLYDTNKALLCSVEFELLAGQDKMEQFALLFSQTWILHSELRPKKEERRLVA